MEAVEPQPGTQDKFGFTIERFVDLLEWCNIDDRSLHEECIHIVPDSETGYVLLYRTVGEVGDNRRVKTIVRDVRVNNRSEKVTHWCLHSGEANTFITFINLMAKEKTDTQLMLDYYPDNGKGMTEDSPITEEIMYLEYKTESDRERQSIIQSCYRNYLQMFGKTGL